MAAAPTDVPTVTYFLVLLQPGESHAAAEHFAAHDQFVGAMEAAETVLLGGSFGLAIEGAEGGYLLHVADLAEAEVVAAQDPLILARVCEPKIVAWDLVGICRGAVDAAFENSG